MGKRMLRRTAILAAISAAVVGVTTGGVANAAKPARGCPTSFQLTAYDPDTMPAGLDKNQNGMVCVKDTGNGFGNGVDDTSNASS